MDTKIDLKKIYLGKATAEGEKNELHKYFVSTRSYLNAKDERKRKLFYIAHRGSGKSALFNQLTHEYSLKTNNIISQINPAEYSYETFTNLKHSFFDVKASYSLAWEYTLIVQLFQEVSKYFLAHKNLRKNRDNIKLIDNYLLNNKFRDAETRLEIFLDFLHRIDVTKINIEYKGFKVSNSKKDSPTKKLISLYNLEDIRKPLRALEQIAEQHPIYMFIDELDTGWNNTKEAQNFISGLISASIKINNISGVTVFLSLRQDMYNNLSSAFSDTEKIRDEIEYINWSKDLLVSVICNRISDNKEIQTKTNHLGYISNEDILNLIFEDKTFDYLLSGTLYRPREIIHYCNLALEKYAETYLSRKLYNSKIDNETIDLVSQTFSRNRYSDFCAEFKHEYPELKNLLDNFEGSFDTYPKNSFYHKLEECMFYFIETNPDKDWVKPFLDEPNKLMVKLFEIGFIKISINSEDFYAHFERKPQNYNNVKFVKLNKVFAIALDCIDKKAPYKKYP